MLFRLQLPLPIIFAIVLPLGCGHFRPVPATPEVPTELAKVNLPEYVIQPPDILKIDALQLVPRGPYKIQTLDVLYASATGVDQDSPIKGLYSVDPEGTISFGLSYPAVVVVGLTIEEAKKQIQEALHKEFQNPRLDLTIAQGRGLQQVRGEHLVRPDGTVDLGSYGSVRVSGLTLKDAKWAIETQLAGKVKSPEVTVDVLAYNSMVYYVIFDQAGQGQRIYTLPVTGSETVLDAFGKVSGTSVVSDERRIWIDRPSKAGEPDKVLAVDWKGITTRGRSETNYQVLPGDRLYVRAYPLVSLDNSLARAIAPIERLFGIVLLGNSTVQSIHQTNNGNGIQ